MTYSPSQQGHQQIFYTTIGIVEDTNDPAQMGRVRVYCPSIDHEDHNTDDLPWTLYASPFGGAIKNMAAGPDGEVAYGPTSYGFWAVPKLGATVLVQFINGDTNYRVWTHCIYPIMGNRGLPGGRGVDITKPPQERPLGPFSDSYEDYEPAKSNLKDAGLDKDHYFTRGGYERQVAQATTDKDGTEGYAKNPNKTDPKDLDPQTYCIVTPGHHYISMQDAPDFCRVRIKTTTGHQVLLDDTNDRIYVSTNRGKTWFEMDSDGHIHAYAAKSVSYTTDGDFNVTAVGNINLDAGGAINMTGAQGMNLTSGHDISLNSGCSTLITAGDNFEAGSTGPIKFKGSEIHLNTGGTTAASVAAKPGIVPTHEPFGRPKSDEPRNKYWKP